MNDLKRILVVEDDRNMAFLLKDLLLENQYDVRLSDTAIKAMEIFNEESIDLCLLDIMLAEGDGIGLARSIREKDKEVPIIFLTSRNLKSDVLLGYEVGADDYITKPFDPDVLLVKIKAVLQRSRTSASEEDALSMGDCKLDKTMRKMICKGEEVKLSATEFGILWELMSNQGKSVSREDIMKKVWGKSDFFVSKSLDVYITRIRKILAERSKVHIETIHGFGYSLK